ncbi:cadherin domain-containing protein [Roseibium porphyridii]|uniref:Cadherin domain-containing protein n=1 Tax=Roseibium porphyridii TaxID=2866279 RepID=A0ABY8F176_9HYPH|nr:cadherin domain-containing protein [Roseibium sp. KMA01]WFE87585.1 cadherin domain-containing protein [Roseibium sp. KMA01]
MASDTENRDPKNSDSSEAGSGESRTTVNSDSMLHSGMLDTRDQHLDKAHDYHLDQDMGESVEQVNANLHLGSRTPEPLSSEQGAHTSTSDETADPAAELPKIAQLDIGPTESGASFGAALPAEIADERLGREADVVGSGATDPAAILSREPLQFDIPVTERTEENEQTESRSSVDVQSNEVRAEATEQGETAQALPLSAVVDVDASENTVDENSTIGVSTGIQASATAGQDAVVTYSLLDDANGLFSIDPETGIVAVAGQLDAETAASHQITVVATAPDGATQSEVFTISIRDVNEDGVTSVSDTDQSANTFAEDAKEGSKVGITASATDGDSTDKVSYSVDDPRFEIDENGIVTIAEDAVFDAENEGSVSIAITATSTDGSSSTETFNLSVSDVNEADVSDVSDADTSANTIAEDAGEGTKVGITALATDADGSDTVSYSLDDDRFLVDGNGVVTVAPGVSFDAETEGSIDVTVTATSTDGSTSRETFTISVSDVDEADVSAVSDTDTAANTIAENAGEGAQVGITALANDADVSDTVSYSVDDSRFSVDGSGVVTVASGASFDAETEGSIDVTVTATSTDGSTSQESFTISVADVDEAGVSAVSDTDTAANTIAEDAGEGAQVGITALATDADATDTVSYSVDDARFAVDGNGVVTVASGASFDAETEGSVDVTVTATSTDGSTSQETFTISVSDIDEADVSAVADTDTNANTIAENAGEGTQVGITALATDTDVSDSVSYSVDDSRFSVDGNGVVTVASGASFDAETEGSVDVTVTATSTDGSTSQETFTISVSDVDEADVSAVADTDTNANTIAENAGEGAQVGITALATDADATDTVSYSVDDARFAVDGNGVVTVASGASFDAETEGSVDVTVTATSTDGSTSQETFTISVSDIDEADVSAVSDTDASANTIAENAGEGAQVGITALATDADATDTVSYSVDDARFAVDGNGVVTVASGASFDAETEGSVDVTVTATSTDGSTSQETFTISVSDVDEADVSAVSDTDTTANTIAENAGEGTQVGITALATDTDVSDSVSYSVDDSRFSVDGNGVLTVASGASFDAETEGSIDVTVTATSSDGSTSQETFTISVSDVDEADVSAVADTDTNANTIAENAGEGTQVGITALATDADVSDSVSYSVDDNRFSVDGNGVVTVAPGASFDAETEGSVDVTVTATSTDGSTSQETFTISVSDVDEADVSAVSDTDATANTVAENAGEGTQVGITALATDADATDTVSYAVDDSRFSVDGNGVVTVVSGASFDAETEGSIDVTVTATSTDGSTSQETFTVSVSDVDEADVSAVSDTDASANTIAEDAGEGNQVGITALATDADATDTVSYAVDDSRFSVDGNGVVTVASGASFDAETEGSIDVTVTATSTDGSTSQETFAVSVTDVNEQVVANDDGASVGGTATTFYYSDDDGELHLIGADGSDAVIGSTGVGPLTDIALDPDGNLYGVSFSHLYSVDPQTGAATQISTSFFPSSINALEFGPDGTLYAAGGSGELFTIDADTGVATLVGDMDYSSAGDLAFAGGSLYLATSTGDVVEVDPATGDTVGVVTTLPSTSAFGLVGDAAGNLYALTDDKMVYQIDPETGAISTPDNYSMNDSGWGAAATSSSSEDVSSQVEGNVLSNDLDPEDSMSVSNIRFEGADHVPGTEIQGTYGTITINSDGSYTYSLDETKTETKGLAEGETAEELFTYTVTDSGGLTDTATLKISVEGYNNAPTAVLLDGAAADATPHTLTENDAGAVIASLTTIDADTGDSHTYSVDDSRFEVVAGQLKLKDGVSLDRESEASITVNVTSTDENGASHTEEVTIAVSDVDETDVASVSDSDGTANTIAENASAGTQVGITALASDADATDTVSYSVDDSRFSVDGNGVVTVATGADFDAETEGSVDITVTATSTDGSSSQETFTVSVSDIDEFDISTVTDADASADAFSEDVVAGTQVGVSAQASDADITDDVTYTVSDNRFTVDADGLVTVAANASFDYENEPTVYLTVTATSDDGTTSQETFEVSVADVAEAYQLQDGQTTFTDDGVAETSITGTDAAETITGHDDGATIYSGGGDDTIYGGDSADHIMFGEGADTVYGGDGNDFIDDEVGTQPNTDANYLDGQGGNDTIYGGGGDDTLIGGEGADILSGENDNDTLTGDAGNDNLYGGAGDDVLEGGSGNDYLDGGSDNDTAVFSGSFADYTISKNDDGSYTVSDNRSGTPDGTDTVHNVETFRFADGDVLAGDLVAEDIGTVRDADTTSNTFSENAGMGTTVGVTAFAEDGNTSDTVSYAVDDSRFTVDSDGTVKVASGASFDYESEPQITITVTATSTDGSTSDQSFTLDVTDVAENQQLSDVGVTFTDTGVGETSITGGAGNDTITAHDDGGTIFGGAGADTLTGGDGADAIYTGSGADTVDGGDGSDTIYLDDSDGGRTNTIVDTGTSGTDTIVLNSGSGTYRVQGNFSAASGIEAIDGSGATGDQLGTRDAQANFDFSNVTLTGVDEIIGTTNDDTIVGSSSDDKISLDAGSDTVTGGTGDDELDGGEGTDTAIYSGNFADYDISENVDGSYTITDLRTGGPDGTDTVSNVENFRFADGDVLAGDLTNSNVGAVTDSDNSSNTIHETDGGGTLVGVTAAATDPDGDSVSYSLNDDRFEVSDDGIITVANHAFFDSQTESSIDLTVTATSTDGSQSSETFSISVAGDYDYEATGGLANGYFSETTQSVSIDGIGGDDQIYTGDYNDRLEGGSVDGNDILSAGGGRDLIFGDGGADNIYAGAGDDVIIGGTGDDNILGQDGSDLFMHGLGDGSDTISAGQGAAWTDVIDLGGGPGVVSAGDYGTDWTVTVTSGSIESTDTDAGKIDLSQDADGYIDFSDGSRVTFNDVEEIRW